MCTILKDVLRHDVNPALGCTEPGAIALACSKAMGTVKERNHTGNDVLVSEVRVRLSPGIVKNATGVAIPNANGEKGCAMAAALGILGGNPDAGLQVLEGIKQLDVDVARYMIEEGTIRVELDSTKSGFFIDAYVDTSHGWARVLVEDAHTNVTRIEYDGHVVFSAKAGMNGGGNGRDMLDKALSDLTVERMVELARNIDEDDRKHIWNGVLMNLAAAKAGRDYGKYGSFLALKAEGTNDICATTYALAACAVDARMGGVNLPVMSSGGSGNQGVVTILVPYSVGTHNGVDQRTIEESIALAHLVNSYVKVFTGDIAPICGCAIAAGVGAAAALVYQSGKPELIGKAINTMVADIAGLLCDGAKGGCSLKVITSVSSCIRAAEFAIAGYGASVTDGIVGSTPESTLQNLGKVSGTMDGVDSQVLEILSEKLGTDRYRNHN